MSEISGLSYIGAFPTDIALSVMPAGNFFLFLSMFLSTRLAHPIRVFFYFFHFFLAVKFSSKANDGPCCAARVSS